MIGASLVNPVLNSSIAATVFASGNGGDITLSTGRLTVEGGATVTAVTLGSGTAGSLNVRATDIEITGLEPRTFVPSIVSSISLVQGQAGNVTIDTASLAIRDGGRIEASSAGQGDAGNVTVNASKVVEVSGKAPGTINPSLLASGAITQDVILQQIFGLPPAPSGNSGDVTINTAVLRVRDDALVNVRNDGSGNAGTLRVNAGLIVLDNQGGLTASTASGNGGNIVLQAQDLLLLRNGSQITTTAGGTGNGGNITINSPLLVAVPQENSDIRANAFEGRGGNVQVTASGLFGIQFRPQNTPLSDITASSQFGFSGTVTISNPEVNPVQGLAELPVTVTDPSNQIAVGCAAARGNSFTVTGRGGLPEDPTGIIRGQTVWRDFQDFSQDTGVVNAPSQNPQALISKPSPRLVEANSWMYDELGNVVLVAVEGNGTSSTYRSRQPDCQDLSSSQTPTN